MQNIVKISALALIVASSIYAPVPEKAHTLPNFGEFSQCNPYPVFRLDEFATDEWPWVDLFDGHTFQSQYVTGLSSYNLSDGPVYYIFYDNPDAYDQPTMIRVTWCLYCAVEYCVNNCVDMSCTLVSCHYGNCLTNYEDLTYLEEYGYTYYRFGEHIDCLDGAKTGLVD